MFIVSAAELALSFALVAGPPCPEEGDTRVDGIEISGFFSALCSGQRNCIAYQVTVSASDASGDGALLYDFTAAAQDGSGAMLLQGPQAENTATFYFPDDVLGDWTFTVVADADPACADPPGSASAVWFLTHLGGIVRPGDLSGDAALGIEDALGILQLLFVDRELRLPCGDGSVEDPANSALLDFSGNAAVPEIPDAIGILTRVFVDANVCHVLGDECYRLSGCPATDCGR